MPMSEVDFLGITVFLRLILYLGGLIWLSTLAVRNNGRQTKLPLVSMRFVTMKSISTIKNCLSYDSISIFRSNYYL
jgi:hypothetical protein